MTSVACLQPAALHVLDLERSVGSQTVELWTQLAGVSYLKTILDLFVRRGTSVQRGLGAGEVNGELEQVCLSM